MTAPRTPRSYSADAVLLGLAIFWSVTFVLVKDALELSDPFTFLTLRFALGGAVALVLAGRRLRTPGLWGPGVLLGAFLALGFVLQTWGLVFTTPARSAFLTGLNVLVVPLLSVLILRRWPGWTSLLGVVLAVAGLYALTSTSAPADAPFQPLGDALSLGCAVAYAGHLALTEKLAPGRPAAALVAIELCTVAAVCALCLPFVERRLAPTPGYWATVAFCGVFASAAAISLGTWAQARTTAVRAALIYSLEPVFAALLSVSLGRERLGLAGVAGGALIVLGVVTSELGPLAWQRLRAPKASLPGAGAPRDDAPSS